MVDVSTKSSGSRVAVARAIVRFPQDHAARLLRAGGPKGPIEEVARVAGILAAKRTGELVPLCHSIAVEHVEIGFGVRDRRRIEVLCRVSTSAKTGVEMEALLGAAVAALTVYDMTKAVDMGTVIERLELVEKRGGKSGDWVRRERRLGGRGGRATPRVRGV
jgi:cyclic pyranopterin phosphate synthase